MTLTQKGQIKREGRIHFNDAGISIWEDGISAARAAGGYAAEKAWKLAFKRQVFARVVQTLNRLGWTCTIPQDYIKHYSLPFARDHRECYKGDLKGFLSVSGRVIEFGMWQGINTPTRPDYGGRYESNKEACMPYVLRLEMERTRRKIRDYLCNVFSGYEFQPAKISSPNPDPLAYFNDSWNGNYERAKGINRFDRGPDGWPSGNELASWDRKDQDGAQLNHGDVRCIRDRNGRLMRGKVYGGINGIWIFVYGPGERDFMHYRANRFFTYKAGETPRKLIPQSDQQRRLQTELKKAVDAMDFKRAQVLKEILHPS